MNKAKVLTYNFHFNLCRILFFTVLLFSKFTWGQVTIFTESMGSVGGTTAITTHETANGFDNDGYTMTSGGATNAADIRSSSASSGYTGASGNANVWFTSTSGQYGFAIEGIDASPYSSLTIDFAVRKESAAGTAFATFALEYWDGSAYQSVALSGLPTSGNSTGWYLISGITLPSAACINGLKLRFTKTGTIACRLDDIILKGNSSCIEPTTQPSSVTASAIGMNSMTISWTNGNGSNRLVAVKPTTSPSFAPVDGTSYTANTVYGQGSSLGYGWVVYNGTGNNVTVTGLTPNTTYYFLIYEFNCTYYDTLFPAAVNATTLSGIVINEIMVNPAGTNDGTNMPNTSEWIEFYNASSSPIDISCWFFTDGDWAVTFPATTIIPAGGYFTVASAAGSGLTPDLDWALCGCTSGPASEIGIFTNSAEQVLLYNSSGTLIDAIIWGGGQLPDNMTTSAIGSCGSQSVTFPSSTSSYENIGSVSDGVANEAVYDGGSTWQPTVSSTFGASNGVDPLPIELLYFNAFRTNGSSVEIKWTTATEINNDYYTIEKSKDGISFSLVKIVDGAGNSLSANNYDSFDNEPYSGLSYYRLKQTDFDGNHSYSNTVTVDMGSTFSVLPVYPNPAENHINIPFNGQPGDEICIKIYDIFGHLILTEQKQKSSTDATINLDLLSVGTYNINITTKSYSNNQLFIKR